MKTREISATAVITGTSLTRLLLSNLSRAFDGDSFPEVVSDPDEPKMASPRSNDSETG